MLRKYPLTTDIRSAAIAALVTVAGILITGCGGSGGGAGALAEAMGPVPSVQANDPIADETGGTTAQFTITLNKPTETDLPINIVFDGNAVLGSDFTSDYVDVVTIPAGSDSAVVTITPIPDDIDEYHEELMLKVVIGQNYQPNLLKWKAVAYILDELPEVSVETPTPSLFEDDENGEFLVRLNKPAVTDVNVHFTLSGDAAGTTDPAGTTEPAGDTGDPTSGPDYRVTSTTMVTIPAGSDKAVVTVTPIADEETEMAETITLDLVVGDNFLAGASTSATISLLDIPTNPRISVSAASPRALEGKHNGQFLIELRKNTEEDLTVTFNLDGTASGTGTGKDYNIDHTAEVTISAGTNSATITVTPIDDSSVEGIETVNLTLNLPDGYIVGNSKTASIEIEDMPEDFTMAFGGWLDRNMEMKAIPWGTFLMGSEFDLENLDAPPKDPMALPHEFPQHEVLISRSFWMCSTETTTGQFLEFIRDVQAQNAEQGDNMSPPEEGTPGTAIVDPLEGVEVGWEFCPLMLNENGEVERRGFFFGALPGQPMVALSREAVDNFCTWLNEREAVSGNIPSGYEFRLPTEAEWEYACRAGTSTIFNYGDDTIEYNQGVDDLPPGTFYNELDQHAWYLESSLESLIPITKIVARKPANLWGLYDMHGNAAEMCYDNLVNYPLTGESEIDPVRRGTELDLAQVIRGGSFVAPGINCRSAARLAFPKILPMPIVGFRVVLAQVIP